MCVAAKLFCEKMDLKEVYGQIVYRPRGFDNAIWVRAAMTRRIISAGVSYSPAVSLNLATEFQFDLSKGLRVKGICGWPMIWRYGLNWNINSIVKSL